MIPARKAFSPLFHLFACLLCIAPATVASGSVEPEAAAVIERYVEAMGGRGSLEKISSVRLSGTIRYPDGSRHFLTVLKKKPDRIRLSINTGTLRFTQAYDGEVAWSSTHFKGDSVSRLMGPAEADRFIREAPLENALINPGASGATISRGPEVTLAGKPGFQLIAVYPDGSRSVFHIEKETHFERRIIEYDPNGAFISEVIPSRFEKFSGVVFALQIIRRDASGTNLSTLVIDEVETNLGILDSAFAPPATLAPATDQE